MRAASVLVLSLAAASLIGGAAVFACRRRNEEPVRAHVPLPAGGAAVDEPDAGASLVEDARRYDVPLFKRYDTMQYWWSHDVFDLDAEGKANQLDNADHIHDCVAALLVRVIQRGVAPGGRP